MLSWQNMLNATIADSRQLRKQEAPVSLDATGQWQTCVVAAGQQKSAKMQQIM